MISCPSGLTIEPAAADSALKRENLKKKKIDIEEGRII